MKILGERIAALRRGKKLTQDQLGKNFGLTKGTISNYETGVHDPGLELLIKIALFFEVSTDYLLGIEVRPFQGELDEKLLENLSVDQVRQMMKTLSAKHRAALYQVFTAFHEQDRS